MFLGTEAAYIPPTLHVWLLNSSSGSIAQGRDTSELAASPLLSWGVHVWGNWLHHPYLRASQHSPRDNLRNGCLTPSILGAQMWAK